MTQPTTQSQAIGYIDGVYKPRAELALPMTDVGFKLCDMCYDAVHVWDGAFFRLEDHLDRFEQSVARRRYNFPLDRDEVRDVLIECVRRSGLRRSMVMLIATRGDVHWPTLDLRKCRSRFIAWADPYYSIVTEEELETGTPIVISKVPRVSPESIDPTIKNFARLDFAEALFDAYEQGVEHAVLLDQDGNVTEGRGWNLFALFGGVLVTPESGVLEGITRRTVLELCEQTNLEPRVAKLGADELKRADEVFMASTAGGIMPISRIDDVTVGAGAAGPVTRRINDLYWAQHRDPACMTPIDYAA